MHRFFFFIGREIVKKRIAKPVKQRRRMSTRTPRFGEITLPLKRDYAIEIVLNASSSREVEMSSLTSPVLHHREAQFFFHEVQTQQRCASRIREWRHLHKVTCVNCKPGVHETSPVFFANRVRHRLPRHGGLMAKWRQDGLRNNSRWSREFVDFFWLCDLPKAVVIIKLSAIKRVVLIEYVKLWKRREFSHSSI